MTIIPVYSVTYRDEDQQIRVEIYDREEEAVARHDIIAADGADVLVQYHSVEVGPGA